MFSGVLCPLGETGCKLASDLINNQGWPSTFDLLPSSFSSGIGDMYYHIPFKHLFNILFLQSWRLDVGPHKMRQGLSSWTMVSALFSVGEVSVVHAILEGDGATLPRSLIVSPSDPQ